MNFSQIIGSLLEEATFLSWQDWAGGGFIAAFFLCIFFLALYRIAKGAHMRH